MQKHISRRTIFSTNTLHIWVNLHDNKNLRHNLALVKVTTACLYLEVDSSSKISKTRNDMRHDNDMVN